MDISLFMSDFIKPSVFKDIQEKLKFRIKKFYLRPTTFYKIRKLIGGLSSEIWKTGDPVSSMSLAHPCFTVITISGYN